MAVSQAATVLFWLLASIIFILSPVSQQIACFYGRMFKSSRYYAYSAMFKQCIMTFSRSRISQGATGAMSAPIVLIIFLC